MLNLSYFHRDSKRHEMNINRYCLEKSFVEQEEEQEENIFYFYCDRWTIK